MTNTYSQSSILHSHCTHISALWATEFQFLVQDGKRVGVCIAVNIYCNGKFDVNRVVVYNILNLGHFVVNSFENTFNFCIGLIVGRLNEKRKCSRCRRMLKLYVDRRDHTTSPVVLRCSNKPYPKDYYFICDGTCLYSSKLPLEWENSLAAGGLRPSFQCGAYSIPQDCSWWPGGWLPYSQ